MTRGLKRDTETVAFPKIDSEKVPRKLILLFWKLHSKVMVFKMIKISSIPFWFLKKILIIKSFCLTRFFGIVIVFELYSILLLQV